VTIINTAAEATYPSSSSQEECWEPDSTPVSSTNNEATEDMSITLTYEGEENPVSSSTFPSSQASTATVVDGVSSTTGTEYGFGGDYFDTFGIASSSTASSSHPLWGDKDVISTSEVFGDSMEDEESGETERENSNTNPPVSSSSDMKSNPRSSGYTKLEEVE